MGAAECTDFHNDDARMTVAPGAKGSTALGVRLAPGAFRSICQIAILSASGRRAPHKGIVVDLNQTDYSCRWFASKIPVVRCNTRQQIFM